MSFFDELLHNKSFNFSNPETENKNIRHYKLYNVPKYKEEFLYISSIMVFISMIFNFLVIPIRTMYLLGNNFYSTMLKIFNKVPANNSKEQQSKYSEAKQIKYYLIKIAIFTSGFWFLSVSKFVLILNLFLIN